MDTYYIDGRFVPADRAVIPVDDLAVLRGLGAFDLLRTFRGQPYLLEEHLQRLERSAARIGLKIPWTREELRTVVRETLARNDHPESNIRIVVTGGSSPDFMTPQGKPRLLVLVSPMPRYPGWWYEKGIKIITQPTERFKPDVKSINYIPATIALERARQEGASEAVYTSRDDLVLECTASNIFLFVGTTLVTPGRGILSGTTRRVILELSREIFDVEIRDVRREELPAAAEVFITGSSKGVVPVVRIDDTPVADGRPGPRTRRLMAALEERMARATEDDKNGGATPPPAGDAGEPQAETP